MREARLTLSGFHPLRFFSKLGKTEKNVAFFTSGEWQILAWNPVRTIIGNDASVFQKLKTLLKKKTALPFAGGAIGYCTYDLGCILQGVRSRHRSVLPLAVFHVYDAAVLWNGTEVFVVGDDRFIAEVQDIHTRPFVDQLCAPIAWESTCGKTAYRKKFTNVMTGIRAGDFYQLNLSYPFVAESDTNPRTLFAALAETNPAPCASYFEHNDFTVVSLSPERFVTIEKGVITTRPIKGTRPRGTTPSDDKRLAAGLLASSKEAAELSMITDLLRNDIGKVSATGTVNVLTHRALQKNPSVWHTYSVIQGTLEKNLHPVDAFASMFPGGSVTGCPKVAAMREIDYFEDQARGAYCGSMLLVSAGGNLDSTILIRTIVATKKRLTLGMGGGIVADSDCSDEYAETLKKAQPFLTFSSLHTPRYFRGFREIPASTSLERIFDPGNRTISGVFETMRADDGNIHDLHTHVLRLRSSAALLGIRVPSASVLTHHLRAAVKKSPATTFRIKIVCTKDDTVIRASPLTRDPAREHGIAALSVPLHRALPQAKSLPYHREYAAHHAALRRGYAEALIRRRDGSICEGAYSNLFVVNAGTLRTANADILFGITRGRVLRLAKRLKIPVRFLALQEHDLLTADEVFITSSLSGITPVLRLGERLIGNGSVGGVTKVLMEHSVSLRDATPVSS